MIKKYINYYLVFFIFISIFACLIFGVKQFKENYSINGTYVSEKNKLNSISFDEESNKYYFYENGLSDYNKIGSFEKKSENNYLLKTGFLAGAKIKLYKKEIHIIFNEVAEEYRKITDTPSIINKNTL